LILNLEFSGSIKGSSVAPSTLEAVTVKIPKSSNAIKTLEKQLPNSKAPTKIKKIEQRIEAHKQNVSGTRNLIIGITGAKAVSKAVANEEE